MNISRLSVFGTALITSLGYVVVQLDVTIVNVALPTFSRVFNTDISALQWIPDAYVIVFAGLLLAAGGLGDKFGNKKINITGVFIFLCSSLLCAFSSTIEAMIAGRILQGVGAALILPSSLALLSARCEGDRSLRTRAIGWWSAIGGIISATGPLLGGVIIEHLTWDVIFLINIPVCILGIILTYFLVDDPVEDQCRDIDGKGIVLFVSVSFSAVYLLIQSGRHSVITLQNLFVLSVFFMSMTLLIHHIRKKNDAFVSLSLLKTPVFSLSLLLGALMNFAFYGSIFLLTIYFQVYRGFSPVMTGLALLTFTVIALANIISGFFSDKIGEKLTITLGLFIGSLTYFILAFLSYVNADFTTFVIFLFLMPLGGGIALPVMLSTFLHNAPPGKTATASAAINAMRQLGGAVGVALLGLLVTGRNFSIGTGTTIGFLTSALLMFSAAFVVYVKFSEERS